MKHRDLIIAAMDGKPFQVARAQGPWYPWNVESVLLHFSKFPDGCNGWKYRIKPEPVPDAIYAGTFTFFLEGGRVGLEKFPLVNSTVFRKLRLTLKTDDNGVVTEYVEIVK